MKRAVVMVILIASFFLSACQPPVASNADAPVTPQPTPVATVAPLPLPTVFSVNPISAYYAACDQATAKRLAAFRAALSAEASIEELDASLALDQHMAQVYKARVSVGRLAENSGRSYSGSLFGAASGSGSMTFSSDAQAYAYSFSYADGTLLRGIMLEGQLVFSLCDTFVQDVVTQEVDAETGETYEVRTAQTVAGEAYCTCCLLRTDDSWSSCVQEGLTITALQISPASVEFMEVTLPADLEQAPELQFDALYPYARRVLSYTDGTLTYSVQNHS